MEIQLKQRLVGLTVIFSLAVIFIPMLLDGSGLSPKHLDISIPPAPQIETNIRVEEKVIELKKETASLKTLTPVIVDEISDPPDTPAIASASQEKTQKIEQPVQEKISSKAAAEKKSEQPPAVKIVQKAEPTVVQKAQPKIVKKEVTPVAKARSQPSPQIGGNLWVIQTGSFRDKNLAYKQRDRVRKSKLSAVFIEKFEKNRRLNYRVRMGPFLTRKKADIVRNKVRAKYNIKAIVMKYEK